MKGARAFQPSEPPSRRAARVRLSALIGFVGLSMLAGLSHAALLAGSAPPARYADLLPWPWEPAWGALYACTGLAAWLVWRRMDVGLERKRAALRRWGWQVLLSGLWPAALFGAHSPALAVGLMVVLLAVLALTFVAFLKVQKGAALLLLPYSALLCCAACLNADCFWLIGFRGMTGS